MLSGQQRWVVLRAPSAVSAFYRQKLQCNRSKNPLCYANGATQNSFWLLLLQPVKFTEVRAADIVIVLLVVFFVVFFYK